MKQQVYIVSGPDRSGKTSIAKLLSQELGIPYFKFSQDKKALSGSDMTSLMLKISDPYFVEFLKQTGYSAIIDRHYESEWCYSHVLGRKTDEEGVWETDRLFSEIPATFLTFKRKSYEGVSDDDPRLNQETLEKLAKQYDEFANRSKCRVLTFEFDKFEPVEMAKEVLNRIDEKK